PQTFALVLGSWYRHLRHSFYFFSFVYYVSVSPYIFTLSLHDALPISPILSLGRCRGVDLRPDVRLGRHGAERHQERPGVPHRLRDRKSTRLNSSHVSISYAVFCLKKKKIMTYPR